jgi:hypothetical protein
MSLKTNEEVEMTMEEVKKNKLKGWEREREREREREETETKRNEAGVE